MARSAPKVPAMTTEFSAPEQVQRFIFENRPVRGHWVGIGQGWRDLRQFREYSPPVQELLGQAVCAALLLAATLKFKGTLTLQLQGNGAVGLLVAQCTHDFRYRALARSQGDGAATSLTPEVFRWLVGEEGELTVTIEAEERELRYQGVVPLAGHSLAACLEQYFASSEQLPTRVRLAADANMPRACWCSACPARAAWRPNPPMMRPAPPGRCAGQSRGGDRRRSAAFHRRGTADAGLPPARRAGVCRASRCSSSAAAIPQRVDSMLRGLGAGRKCARC